MIYSAYEPCLVLGPSCAHPGLGQNPCPQKNGPIWSVRAWLLQKLKAAMLLRELKCSAVSQAQLYYVVSVLKHLPLFWDVGELCVSTHALKHNLLWPQLMLLQDV